MPDVVFFLDEKFDTVIGQSDQSKQSDIFFICQLQGWAYDSVENLNTDMLPSYICHYL